ncbi:MAG TPA: winged helix-turn-helix domain-containing protein [Candidatus Angelobacter sp.]|nr:winged helix-turn-helix domain-containing protein [Candidatus Angelobacter sp.]
MSSRFCREVPHVYGSARLFCRHCKIMGDVSKYRFSAFEADVKAAELRRNGTRVRLQMQPFQVLIALLERPGDVVSREELRQRMWPEDTFVDFDHGLNTAMVKLRDVLGDSASSPRYIETIAKRGYRFLEEVTAVQDPPAVVLPQEPVAPPPAVTAEKLVEPQPAVQPEVEPELPRASRTTARALFSLAQIMYLIFYLSALFDWRQLYRASENLWSRGSQIVFTVFLVTSLIGLVVRLYLLTATAFDYHLFGEKYRVLFPALLGLDMLWALSPLLIEDRIGLGLALGSAAALIYMPFAQRVLVRIMGKSTA